MDSTCSVSMPVAPVPAWAPEALVPPVRSCCSYNHVPWATSALEHPAADGGKPCSSKQTVTAFFPK